MQTLGDEFSKTNNANPLNKKAVFLVGNNIAAHRILEKSVRELAAMGIPCDIYLTDAAPQSAQQRERLIRPEVQYLAFAEKLLITHAYPIIENKEIILDNNGDLKDDLIYTPRQLGNYFTAKGVPVTVKDLDNVNDPIFVNRIAADQDIGVAFNIRNLQILEQDAIDAFERNEIYAGQGVYMLNIHPGDVISFPGTSIAFWTRMQNAKENTWTAHRMTREVDDGPTTTMTRKSLRGNKTLLQDMLAMTSDVAVMIRSHAIQVLGGTVIQGVPQKLHPNYASKPEVNFTHPTQEQWVAGWEKGISAANLPKFVPIAIKEHVGDERWGAALRDALNEVVADYNSKFPQLYQGYYGTALPECCPYVNDDYQPQIPSLQKGGGGGGGQTILGDTGRHGATSIMPAGVNDNLGHQDDAFGAPGLHFS